MSVQGKNTLSFKKQNVIEQTSYHQGFKTLVFAHEFLNAGETSIPFASLNQPVSWVQAGLLNPNAATLLSANLRVLKKYITVTSSARGLIQKSEYRVTGNSIVFFNIESLPNEIFEVEVSDQMVTGKTLVDMRTIRVEGELQPAETDILIGHAVDIDKEEVLVFREGIQMHRSDNNDDSGATGNYYYVNPIQNRSSVIRFFEPAVDIEAFMVVSTGGIVDQANVSTFQQIEKLAGQLDIIIPTVAALAGVPESNFQFAPNNVDLKQFGALLYGILNIGIPIRTVPDLYIPIFSAGMGAVSVVRVQYWRDGKFLKANGFFTVGSTGAGFATMSLPPGLTADPAYLAREANTSQNLPFAGHFHRNVNSSGPALGQLGIASVTHTDRLYFCRPFSTLGDSLQAGVNVTEVFNTGENVSFYFEVPILQWNDTDTIKSILGV
jgi:hypothetical protein